MEGAERGTGSLTPTGALAILDHLPGLVTVWGTDCVNRYANQAYLDWFGGDPAAVVGRHISDVLGPDLYERNVPFIHSALEGTSQTFERTLTDPSGNTRHLEVSYVPYWPEPNRQEGFVVLINDISARIRTEKTLSENVRQLALLEERQRIAADLHDMVIQRLFAAGLDLSLHAREHPEASTRVESAALGVDEAIRHLRAAIHSLSLLTTPTQVPASVAKILSNAERTLGFAPTVTTTGSMEQVPPDVASELLAVLTEALSNVARHAGATRVEVSVVCSPEEIVLRVADDGRGMGKADRSSGLTNMRQRAERLGGSCLCKDNDPHGTVIDWWVPLE